MGLVNRLTSDATLVRRALADTPAAFEALVERYQRQACAVARALGVPGSSVDDVVQESFLHAFSGLESLRAPESFGPWLLGIVRNLARKEIEASRRTFDAARLAPGAEPDSGARMEGIREHIWHEVSKLPEGMREAIFLYYHEGESVRRVARALGISASAVKSRLQRGRELLRENLWRELGDSLREMLPSAREWKQKGRKLSLILGALVLPQASASGMVRTASAGALVLSVKKLCVMAAIAVLFLGGGWITTLSFRAGDWGANRDRLALDAEPSPVLKAALPGLPVGAPATEAARLTTSISGTIFSEHSGLPVEQARVALVRDLERGHERVAMSGEGGSYLLADLEPGRYRLWAWREDWTLRSPWSEEHEVEVREGETIEGRDLLLVHGVVVEGRVIDQGMQAPVPGATARFGGLQFAACDAEGRFRLEGMPEGFLQISAWAPGRAEGSVELEAAHGETPRVTIELARGGTIEGKVLDLAGLPAPRVEVVARAASMHETAETDSKGRYRMEGIPLTARDIELTASRGGRFAGHAYLVGFEAGSDSATRDLRLERGFDYRGRIVDASNRPIDGAELSLLGSMGFEPLRSDADGRFAIEGGSERMFRLSASKKGFAPASLDLRDLTPERRESIDLVLEPGRFLEGIVVDSRGPVEGASVHAELEQTMDSAPSTHTDAAGRFRLEDLPGDLRGIGATGDGYADVRGLPAKPGQRDIRIVLEEPGRIDGIVTEKETRAPVHPFIVKARFAAGAFRESDREKGVRGRLHASIGREGLHFDFPDGRFGIRSFLAAGMSYEIMVVAPGYREAVLEGVEAWPRSTPREPVRIELERGEELRGQVVAAGAGEPLAGVAVSHVADRRGEGQEYWCEAIRGQGSPVRTAVTDDRGDFVLQGLSRKPGVLLLEKPGHARTALFDIGPSNELRLFTLELEAVIEGTCRTASGEPIRSAAIEVSLADVRFPPVDTDAGGSFRIGGLPAGAAGVEMRCRGSLKKHSTVTLVAGETTPLELTQGSGSIVGRVTDGGQPVSGAQVLVKNLSNKREQDYLHADARGVFRSGGLDLGSYELVACRPGSFNPFAGVSRTVEVGSGEVRYELSLTPAGSLSGRVIDRVTRSPVPGATVTLLRQDPDFLSVGFRFPGSDWAPSGQSTAAGDEAEFLLEPSLAGTFLLSVRAGDGGTIQGWLGPLELAPGSRVADLTVEVGGAGILSVTARESAGMAPIEGCYIVLRLADAPPMILHAKTDGSGTARVPAVPPGKYRMEVQSERHASFVEDIVVTDGPFEREILLAPASWIVIELAGVADASRDHHVTATLLSGSDPAWPYTSLEGRNCIHGRTGGMGSEIRLKTRPGRHGIRFEVSSPYRNSPPVLTRDLEVDVPEGAEVPILLELPR